MNDRLHADLHDTRQYQAIHAERHLQPFQDHSQLPSGIARVMVKGKGMRLWDSEGKQYLDGMSGLWCTAVGYGREELVKAASAQMEELSFCSQFSYNTHPAVINLTSKLFSLLPDRFGRVLYTNSGSEANEVLIRVVRRFWDIEGKPEKKIFISRVNGYHGSTVGSASLSGMSYMHEMGDLPIPGIAHIGQPYWFGHEGDFSPEEFGLRAAAELESKILELGPDRIAAFVAEPFQGAGGMIFPPPTYWPEIQRICRKYDVLICADEVVGGFGRTGEWFAHQHFGFEPDTIAIAKGLTSGYVPMGGLVLSRRIADALAYRGGMFSHGLTYQGHPLAAAVALANLRLLDEGGIVDGVKNDTGPYLQRALRDVFGAHPLVGDIQGAGAVAALQLAPAALGRKRFAREVMIAIFCAEVAYESGLIVRPAQGRIVIAPALIATQAHIDELVEKLKRAVDCTAIALDMM
jgi:adenosylmethionine-8-amino-7-oxononanoate aminotransferase